MFPLAADASPFTVYASVLIVRPSIDSYLLKMPKSMSSMRRVVLGNGAISSREQAGQVPPLGPPASQRSHQPISGPCRFSLCLGAYFLSL